METKGTGSIVQLEKDRPKGKCRKWQLRVSVGIDPRTGKYRQRTRTFNGTYTEAKRAIPDFIAELSGQTMTKSGKIPTFEECAEEWLEKRISTREVSDGTVETYRIRLHVLSRTIGRVRVDRLTTEQVQESMVAMMDGDTPTGRHAGAQYTRMLCNAGKIMYRKHAIPMGYASTNPFDAVPLPKVEQREQVVLSEDEYQRLAALMRPIDDGRKMGVLLALLAGLRLGECCSLTWKDWQGEKLHVVGTKNAASTATVPISKALQSDLAQWMETQQEQMASLSLEWDETTALVTNPFLKPVPKRSLTVWWIKVRGGLGFPDLRFHDLRHAFVARCCILGINPKVIQRLARHATFAVTMDVYAAVNDQALDDAASML